MKKPLSEFSDEARYTIGAVAEQTGIPAATLRIWERRYALVTPARSEGGYRLYSERDVALLRWARAQTESGVNIGQVAAEMEGADAIWSQSEEIEPALPNRLTESARELAEAMRDLDDLRAARILDRVFTAHTLPTACVDVIGAAWRALQTAPKAVKGFGRAYLTGRLSALAGTFARFPPGAPIAWVGGEGIPIWAVLLRARGIHAHDFGADVQPGDLLPLMEERAPDLVMLAANTPADALALRGFASGIGEAATFAYGGAAFEDDRGLREMIAGFYVPPDPRTALDDLERLLF
jgi:DNA-binding transcriptional MerR regulator